MSSELRKERLVKHEAVRRMNNYGERLLWVREKLNLIISEIVDKTKIPRSTLIDWEKGTRTYHYEDLLLLIKYYDELWQQKYKKGFPEINEVEIVAITLNFILYGKDPTLEEAIELNKENKILKFNIEMEKQAREQAEERAARQGDMFKEFGG